MTIAANLAKLQERIAAAARAANRAPETVALIAVSKTQPMQAVQEAYAAGQRLFGENRVQEADGKFTPLRASCPDLQLQLIGPLQTNKAARAVSLFDSIATLDRHKLATTLAALYARQTNRPELLAEINSGHEPQKAGIAPEALPDFLAQCRDLALPVRGLMCIPPVDSDPAPHFMALTRMADTHQLLIRSMGMSGDFETAIRCGSTHVRIGTALFGSRTTPV